MFQSKHVRPPPYAIAGLLVFVATVLTQVLATILVESQILFLVAVVLSSGMGGLKPALTAAILSALSLKFFLIPPLHTLAVANLEDSIRLGIFLAVALIGSLPGIALERAKMPGLRDRTIQNDDPLHVALQAAGITAREAAEAALQQKAQQEQAFNRVIQTIRNSLDLDTVFATATQEFAELLQLDGVGIPQYLPQQHCWIPVAEYIRKPGTLSLLNVEVPDASNPIAERLKQREMVLIENTHTLQDPVNQSIAQQSAPVAWLMVPLEVDERVWGCLVAIKSPLPVSFTEDEIGLARRFADQLAIAIHQANLYQ